MDGSRLYEQAICLGNVLQLTISLAQVSIRDFGYFDLNLRLRLKQQNIPMNSISCGPFTRKRFTVFPVLTGPITAPSHATRRLAGGAIKNSLKLLC